MVQTIQQLQDAGVEPDVWKIEGLDRREPPVNYRAKKITREAAVAEIARRHEGFVGIFEKARLP
jgi:hypothetical protein